MIKYMDIGHARKTNIYTLGITEKEPSNKMVLVKFIFNVGNDKIVPMLSNVTAPLSTVH